MAAVTVTEAAAGVVVATAGSSSITDCAIAQHHSPKQEQGTPPPSTPPPLLLLLLGLLVQVLETKIWLSGKATYDNNTLYLVLRPDHEKSDDGSNSNQRDGDAGMPGTGKVGGPR